MRGTVTLALVISIVAHAFAQKPQSVSEKQFDELLVQLKSPFSTSARHNQAAEQLKLLGTNALTLLIKDVRSIDQIAKTNSPLAHARADQLQAAFIVLGKEARPILPELVEEFRNGRSLGNAPHAIAQIGDYEAIRILIGGLTNREYNVKVSSANAIQSLKGNPLAAEAIGPLISLLNDQPNSYLRALAVSTLASLAAEPDKSIPALLTAAEKDNDSGVRAVAVKAIGRFGSAAKFAKERLQKIAANDPELAVRREAERLLNKF